MHRLFLTDDSKDNISLLLRSRLPWLVIGLIIGIIATIFIAGFEEILSENIALAFFLPVIVYMTDAIGTQTETIYVRFLSKYKDNFAAYILKEIMIGLVFGTIFGLLLFGFAFIWLHAIQIAMTVGITMFINACIAPVLALLIPEFIFKQHSDPALGAGPFTTVIQDLISILIYFTVAAIII